MSLKRVWAPWRQPYVAKVGTAALERGACLFCQKGISRRLDRDLVVAQGRFAFSLMNLFPYSNGHLMAAPYRHVPDLKSLTLQEQVDLFAVINDGLARLEKVLRPQGFNLGANLGRAAGAGIPGHLHFHIVPRWMGDTNFMPICAETKVISQSLRETYRRLARFSSRPRKRSDRPRR